MPSNVRVAIRMRPLLANELSSGHHRNQLDVDPSQGNVSISTDNDNGTVARKTYKFDKVIDDSFS